MQYLLPGGDVPVPGMTLIVRCQMPGAYPVFIAPYGTCKADGLKVSSSTAHWKGQGSNPPTPWQKTLRQKNRRKTHNSCRRSLNPTWIWNTGCAMVPQRSGPTPPTHVYVQYFVLRDVACIYTSSTGGGIFTREGPTGQNTYSDRMPLKTPARWDFALDISCLGIPSSCMFLLASLLLFFSLFISFSWCPCLSRSVEIFSFLMSVDVPTPRTESPRQEIRPHRRCWGVIIRMALVKGLKV